jgi:uncharacterized protein
MDYLIRFLSALYSYLGEAAPYLVIGYLVVALVREYVPESVLTRHLGGRGAAPLLKALGIGSLLPVCSCGTVPLGIGLVRSGAASGTTLTFMTSAPAISPVAIIVGYSLLGLPLLAVFAITVVVGSLLLGVVGNRWLASGDRPVVVPAGGANCSAGDDCCVVEKKVGHGARIRSAIHWAFADLGADVSVDLLAGLAVAAAIVAVLPTAWIATAFGNRHWWSILGVILIAVPIYTCTVPSLFIVHSLLIAGASPGAAIAFLVAGPATNLGEINAIRGAMGLRTALYYVLVLVVVGLTGGLVTDQLIFSDGRYAVPKMDGAASLGEGFRNLAEQIPAWHDPFLVVLILLLAFGLVQRVRAWTSARVQQ